MLDPDDLIASAAADTGHSDFGPETWRPGLARLVDSANAEAALSPAGELIMGDQIGKSLANRLRVIHLRSRHPEIADQRVEAPVIILGLPRTGTTLLSYVLDRDPANRSLMRWEVFASTPPPEPASFASDPRIETARAEMDALYATVPDFKAIHYEAPDGPTECVTVLGQDFRSVHYETMANLPSYGEWHLTCDMVPAYRWHEMVLQVLQWRAPGRWVLKSPCHNLALDALDTVYPDARFVVPHRDPATAVASLASLVSVLSGLGTDHDFDHYIGARWLEVTGLMIDRMMAFRDRVGDDRFVDLDFTELAARPLSAVGELYDRLGWKLGADAEGAMARYLTENPRGRWGTHEYSLERFGLSPAQVAERFAAYRDRFALA